VPNVDPCYQFGSLVEGWHAGIDSTMRLGIGLVLLRSAGDRCRFAMGGSKGQTSFLLNREDDSPFAYQATSGSFGAWHFRPVEATGLIFMFFWL